MDELGVIIFKRGFETSIRLWESMIDSVEYLERPESKKGINPFTKAEVLFQVPSTTSRVLDKGKIIGIISLSEDGSESLSMGCYENPKKVREYAEKISSCVGGGLVINEIK